MSEQRKIEWDFTNFTTFDYMVINNLVEDSHDIDYNLEKQGILFYYMSMANRDFELSWLGDKNSAFKHILSFITHVNFHFAIDDNDVNDLIFAMIEHNQIEFIPDKYKNRINGIETINAPKIFEDFINSLED